MSRNLKRVPLDFAWPIDKVWSGYINQHHRNCAACDGSGDTTASQWLGAIVQLLMIAGEDSRRGRLHPYLSNLMNRPGVAWPSAELGELTAGLAGRVPYALGHDSIDGWTAQKKIVAAAGLNPKSWGLCQACKGDGVDPSVKADYEAWTRTEPPAGDGYQLWEDCSEGAPVSPVFAALDDLCIWAADHATTFGSHRATAAEWKQMLDEGFVSHQEGGMIFI